ncbi:MAG: rod shape-determining protein MreD [Stellaceae bacterium]
MALGTLSPAWPPADSLAARLLPTLSLLLASLLSLLPLPVPGGLALSPALALMVTYHWTLYRPELLPVPALFAVGMTEDLLSGGLPGVTALMLVLCREAVLRQRRRFVDRPFGFVWGGFAVVAGAAMAFAWGVNALCDLALLDIRDTLFRAVLTIALFPGASFLLARAQRALMSAG